MIREEKEEYLRSALNLGILLQDDFPAKMKTVTFPSLPDALYLVATEDEASRIQQTGLYIPGIKQGENDNWRPYSYRSNDGKNLSQRLVFTRDRMFRRGGLVRIKVSLRRLQKDDPVVKYISEAYWNYEEGLRRFLISDSGAVVFCDPIRIRPEYCFVLDPICFPPRPASEYSNGAAHLFRAQNSEYQYHGGGSKIWDNVCHLVIANDLRLLNDVSFSGCENLETVRVSDTVEYLGCDSFSNCPKLLEVTIGAAANNRATRVFCNNPKLNGVYIDASLKPEFCRDLNRGYEFGYASWFRNCPNLKSIHFSDGTVMPFPPRG